MLRTVVLVLAATAVALAVASAPKPTEAQCVPSLTTVSGPFAPHGPICSGQVLLNEQFDNINTALWQHEIKLGGPNGEFHWYTNATRNSFTRNGVLYLQPSLTTDVMPDLTNCQINLAG